MTNGDKIRQMSDEELIEKALFVSSCKLCAYIKICDAEDGLLPDYDCKDGVLAWLKQEADE